MIVFVGDQPSAKNISKNIPFVGTQSYKRLLEWIWELDVDISLVTLKNSKNDENLNDWVITACWEKTKIICLGENAAKAMEHAMREWDCPMQFFVLPHPSGLNRKLNDKKYIKKMLRQCKQWINR